MLTNSRGRKYNSGIRAHESFVYSLVKAKLHQASRNIGLLPSELQCGSGCRSSNAPATDKSGESYSFLRSATYANDASFIIATCAGKARLVRRGAGFAPFGEGGVECGLREAAFEL